MNLASELMSHRQKLYRQARKYRINHETAEDLVQETFLKALESESRFDGANLGAWLRIILRNTFVGTCRRNKNMPQVDIEDCAEIDTRHSVAPSQDGAMQMRDLERGLAALPPEQAMCLKMIVARGMDYSDASAVFGVPVNTIKSRVFRARRHLEEMMG